MARKMIPGVVVDFGAEELLVPPLALGDLELLQDRLGKVQVGSMDRESVATVIDATHAALQRNYPEITRERVSRLIDLGNMAEVMLCVMDVSGVHRQELAAGKARAATEGPTTA